MRTKVGCLAIKNRAIWAIPKLGRSPKADVEVLVKHSRQLVDKIRCLQFTAWANPVLHLRLLSKRSQTDLRSKLALNLPSSAKRFKNTIPSNLVNHANKFLMTAISLL